MWKFIKAFGLERGILIVLCFAYFSLLSLLLFPFCICVVVVAAASASFPCVLERWKWNNWIFLLLTRSSVSTGGDLQQQQPWPLAVTETAASTVVAALGPFSETVTAPAAVGPAAEDDVDVVSFLEML